MKIWILAITLLVTGCSTVTTATPTGGSRSDGFVELSYPTKLFAKVDINWSEAEKQAVHRCSAWGYSSAEAFGGGTHQCYSRNAYGNCVSGLMTHKYQCIE